MRDDLLILHGRQVRLEPLAPSHLEGLLAAAAGADPALYQWTHVPRNRAEAARYIETALAGREAGSMIPFATVRVADNLVIGSTRLWNIERWAWPAGHERHGRAGPDACEIGHTWLSHTAVRSAANSEAKLLMLGHAFEHWGALRVCFHTDARNQRSRAALERIGGRFEGILRAHRLAADFSARDSARFSIVAAEWPEAKQRLRERLLRG